MVSHKRHLLTYRSLGLLIVLLGFSLRVSSLGVRSLWLDESVEFWAAQSPLAGLLPAVKTAVSDPPLYSLLLHFWLQLGHPEFVIRFLSLIFSMAGLLGVTVLARAAYGKKASLVAGTLVAVSVPDIRFAQEAGQYALMSFVLVWNSVFLFRLMKHNTWTWAALWAFSGAVAVYSYYGAALTVAATTLVCLIYALARERRDRLPKLLVAAGICGLLILPLVVTWLPDQMFRGARSEAFQVSIGPPVEELRRFLTQTEAVFVYQFLGYQGNVWPWPGIRPWMLWAPAAALILTGLAYRRRLPSLWFVTGLLIYYAAGRLGAYPYGSRYSLILSYLFWVSIAAGIAPLLSPRAQPALRDVPGLSLLGLSVVVALLAPVEAQEDLRSVAQVWRSERRPGDATYVYYGAAPGFRYQLVAAGESETVPSLWYQDCWQGAAVPYCAEAGVFYGRWIRQLAPEEKGQAVLETVGDPPDRLWMVFSHTYPGEDQAMLTALARTYAIAATYPEENAALVLLERR